MLTSKSIAVKIDLSIQKEVDMVLSEEEKADRPFTVDETAEFLKVNINTITRWIKEGKLKATKIGRAWRIKRSEIERLLDGE